MRKWLVVWGAGICLCPSLHAAAAGATAVDGWWSLPFMLLLSCIAFVPFIHKPFWERFFGHISVALGVVVALVYLTQLGGYGREKLAETALEYFKFIALIGSLFVVCGGIHVNVTGGGNSRVNTLLLLTGVILANVVGTTGASMLLIRPFLRLNKERMKPFHVVLFIFSVSNCGGVLTPIGDPPLFLGYINGVPFEWTIVHCFLPWLLTNGVLLAVFYVLDSRTGSPRVRPAVNTVTFAGWGNVICLAAILAGVFIDRFLATAVSPHFAEWPIGAMVMLLAAFVGYRISDPRTLEVNDFHFGPIKEVALLFVGIFATMMPALDYLAAHASQLGIQSPGGFYFAAGSLSSVLDNAPAYLSFLSAALGLKGLALDPGGVQQFAIQYPQHLRAISLGAVFFGACTYIGNGPNFMVKAIADSAGVKTPGFFAYILKFVVPILVPLYVLVWYVFL